MSLESFKASKVIFPEFCYITSVAVGFPVLIYWVGGRLIGKTGDWYQVMRWDDSNGPGKAFWDWYVDHKEQLFKTPEEAASVFVQEHLKWLKKQEAKPVRS